VAFHSRQRSEGRGYSKLQEVQALEQYYRFQEDVVDALGDGTSIAPAPTTAAMAARFEAWAALHAAERRLRMWMSVPINDGKLARPTDEPPKVKIVYDWTELTREGMTRRPELRRQRAQIERAEAELVANKNFPAAAVGSHRPLSPKRFWPGLDGPARSLRSLRQRLVEFDHRPIQEWELGFEYSMPLGFRRGYAAVRNAQLRLPASG